MNKAERNKQKLREKMIIGQANHHIKMAADEAYDKGHSEGFHNCLALVLFAVMECTNYKSNGLRKIWQKAVQISEALEIPGLELTVNDIKFALLEEADIVTDAEFVELADRYLEECGGKVDHPKYKAIVREAMKKYETVRAEEKEGEAVD